MSANLSQADEKRSHIGPIEASSMSGTWNSMKMVDVSRQRDSRALRAAFENRYTRALCQCGLIQGGSCLQRRALRIRPRLFLRREQLKDEPTSLFRTRR